ncbi:MAG: polyphosphate polymerase domain-containing protein [Bacteroidetes bacterium]|nr:polyphosphate polymerase domain-containing protein [Bacteroidota bacterium]
MLPISLKEMDNVKLMDRTDTKYTFALRELGEILNEIKDKYRILEIDGKNISRYETLYFDTSDLSLYSQHHSGKLNRYKIRHRTYVDTNAGYLEIKFKNNKSRTIKSRIKKQTFVKEFDKDSQDFLKKSLPFDPSSLVPVMWVNYNRLTLVNKETPERVTIDLQLQFVKDGGTLNFNSLVIAEIKQESKNPSAFIRVMKARHKREGSISKYCMGIAVSCKGIKMNNFKEKLLTLKKITTYDFTTSGL